MTVGGRGRGARAGGTGKRGGGGGGGGGGGEGRIGKGGGPIGPPLWASRAHHSGPVRPVILGLSGPSSLGPSDPSSPPSIKPVGSPQALIKIKFRPEPGREPNLIEPARPARPVGDA